MDQLVMVELATEDEQTHATFSFPTNRVAGPTSVSGIEAVFQASGLPRGGKGALLLSVSSAVLQASVTREALSTCRLTFCLPLFVR